MPKIIQGKCVSCWGCIPFCPTGAILQTHQGALIHDALCTDCRKCIVVCPLRAIISADNSPKHFSKIKKSTVTHKEGFDMVVLGGGPAGLSSAYFASKAGMSAAVIEHRKVFGVPVACAEGISTVGLNRVFEPRPEWICTTIEGARVITPSGKTIFVDHPSAGYVLDRPIMERDIAGMCAENGAKIFSATTIIEIVGDEKVEQLIAAHENEKIEFLGKFFIGADGIAGHSARWAFPQKNLGNEDYHSCAQVLLSAEGIDEHIPEFFWGNNIAPGGYAWIFPKGNNRANVGLGIIPGLAGGKSPQDFLQKLLEIHFKNYEILERKDGVVPATNRLKPLGRANMLLCGDAARLANAISGGGIDCALLSGKLAATAILKNPDAQYKTIVSRYEKSWHEFLGKNLDLYARLRKGVLRLNDDEFEQIAILLNLLLGGKKWTALDIPKLMMKIAVSQPRLLAIARHFIKA